MALKWSQVKGYDPVALRRWAIWLKVPDAEDEQKMPMRRLLEELFILGYIKEDRAPTAYY